MKQFYCNKCTKIKWITPDEASYSKNGFTFCQPCFEMQSKAFPDKMLDWSAYTHGHMILDEEDDCGHCPCCYG